MEATFVVVGGGIAGVSCAETLAFLEPEKTIILISESSLIKTVTNLHAITRTLTDFDINETDSSYLTNKYLNITVVHDKLTEINDTDHFIVTSSGQIKYEFLCLCMGAEPKLIPQASSFSQIIGIRDTDSVETFVQKLKTAKTIVVVGNGGIASEVVFKIRNVDVHWVVRDKHISATFVDPGAAEFFQSALNHGKSGEEPVYKRMRYSEDSFTKSGAALGPDWYNNLSITGGKGASSTDVKIHYEAEVTNVEALENCDFPIKVALTSGLKIPCDLVVSATGVLPRRNFATLHEFARSEDGGLQVNEFMQTSLKDIYAAGDICAAGWPPAKHWFQMKLWTQARQMGCYAAKCMSAHSNNESLLQDFCFEMFAHSTKLFGYKVILLGLYNGQKLGRNYEILLRMTKEKEYIKFVLEDNKLQGAVLIGDTDLEEMCENLILNQLDLAPYGDDILNPNIDIEDYFD
ncbi:pyridine nucleotide-disulfide oxidoreductase domain-containing protein 1 [Tribolium castaneum]|uniref:Pyridine nucleotide-disulfide oxidoreductase domain-containing protein 1 n=1 Tax=Tribolium castaneum TaxID=7070 RepID=D6WL78_TRICA|nr:PREDICTED: pyridine nucleotide-disulfide oxidoreductase domain-containing protein 1 [Tribolium castaneum]EFA04075.1 Pyridine nucleotide-disulfide oxidoreductase domain-containing protein 1-like Protein [Tribolium castaneum]|eukprot:XP_973566.1 PREDICTED: pyridine nucleotide-disulfide oxidoreductase domain-containing protein 1 [Tribolium castaneum]